MEKNSITFSIEKLFGPDKALKGYFVTKSNEMPSASNPMMDMMKEMAMAMEGRQFQNPKIREDYFVLLPRKCMII